MDIIRAGYDQLIRAPTKTITFTGGAGAGAVGSVTVWTISGRVLIQILPPPFCTTDLTEALATATVSLGVTSSTGFLLGATTSTAIDANEWWDDTTPALGIATDIMTRGSSNPVVVSENIIITCATQATNGGVLVFDCWYRPLTAGASLS